MPVTKSATKRARQALKRHKRNLRVKQNMKREIKALLDVIAENNPKAVGDSLVKAQSAIDKAVKSNLIHKNKAAREKSRLSGLARPKPGAKAATPKPKSPKAKAAPASNTKSAKK